MEHYLLMNNHLRKSDPIHNYSMRVRRRQASLEHHLLSDFNIKILYQVRIQSYLCQVHLLPKNQVLGSKIKQKPN